MRFCTFSIRFMWDRESSACVSGMGGNVRKDGHLQNDLVMIPHLRRCAGAQIWGHFRQARNVLSTLYFLYFTSFFFPARHSCLQYRVGFYRRRYIALGYLSASLVAVRELHLPCRTHLALEFAGIGRCIPTEREYTGVHSEACGLVVHSHESAVDIFCSFRGRRIPYGSKFLIAYNSSTCHLSCKLMSSRGCKVCTGRISCAQVWTAGLVA